MRRVRATTPVGWLVAVLLLVPSLAGCGGGSAADSTGHETLHILAASSLTEVFDIFAQEFEAEHPGVTVTPVYDSSATLVTQLREGAPADLIATADLDTMQTVVKAGEVHPPTVFASNRLVMVTPRKNPANINSFDDLSRDGITWVACVGSAPCGKVARALIKLNKIWNWPSSLEVDVKAVLTKVTTGEADAGLVYATDAVAAGSKVQAFPIPNSGSVVNQYAIAATQQSGAPGLAQDWVDLITSAHGQQVLSDAGFGPAD